VTIRGRPPEPPKAILCGFRLLANERERLWRVARAYGTSATAIVRTAITERVEYLEAKLVAEEERHRREVEDRREFRMGKKLKGLEPLGRPVSKNSKADEKPAALPNDERLTALYAEHAKRIFEVLHDPVEKRLRTREALAAIRKRAPLTHPDEATMLVALEELITRLRVDAEIVVVDPKKVRTGGDVGDSE